MERRNFLKSIGLGSVVLGTVGATKVFAEEKKIVSANKMDLKTAVNAVTGGKAPKESDKIKLTVPEIAENGAVVPVKVEVDSPMSDKDYVKAIHVFAEKNSNCRCADVQLTPANGNAYFATRIKLGGTQKVHAVVALSDGSFITTSKSVKVTIGGCG